MAAETETPGQFIMQNLPALDISFISCLTTKKGL